MKPLLQAVLGASIQFFVLVALAGDADSLLSAKYNTCKSKAVSTLDIQGCISEEVRRQDLRLNTAYKTLVADLSSDRAKQLLEAQRAWIKFRDSNCSFYLDPAGGTIAPIQAGMCKISVTATRAKELEDYLKP